MESIFSTSQRIKILESVIFKTDRFTVNGTASQLKLSKGLVSKYFQILLNEKVLKLEKGNLVVSQSPFVRAIKILFNVQRIDARIFSKSSCVIAAGLFGSCARGENKEESDVDLWVRIKDVKESEAASLTAALTKRIKNVKIMLLNETRLEQIKKEDAMFYHSLVFGSIMIYGDIDVTQV